MKPPFVISCTVVVLAALPATGPCAQASQNVSVTFNGETEASDPLAADAWHTITASYRYPGKLALDHRKLEAYATEASATRLRKLTTGGLPR